MIETQATRDDDEPAALVIDLVVARPQKPSEGLLDDVLCFADVAEHPKGQVHEVRTVGPPRLGELGISLDSSHLTTQLTRRCLAAPP